LEDDVIGFCFRRQQNVQPVAFCDVIDDLAEKSIFVKRFSVSRFVRRQSEKLAVQDPKYLERERQEISAESLKVYSAGISAYLTSVPSDFFWEC
jgi:hypothetical protein